MTRAAVGRKSRLRVSRNPILSVRRVLSPPERTAYFAVVNRPLKYPYGKSRIAYIGTTQAGIQRVATSAAARAPRILNSHGIREVDFYLVTCRPRRRVRIWEKLERALLLVFRERYGAIPVHNTHGSRIQWRDEQKYFTRTFLERVIKQFES